MIMAYLRKAVGAVGGAAKRFVDGFRLRAGVYVFRYGVFFRAVEVEGFV